MANSKISALTSATTPLAGTETLPIVQGGATVKATVANITGSGLYPGSFTTLASTGNTTLGDAVTDTVIALGPVGIGTTSPQGKLAVSNAGVEGFEVSPGIAVGGVVRQIAFNRSTVAYMPMRYQASEHQFYNASSQVVNISSAGNVTFSLGNVIQGTAAKGINFTANIPTAGMTSQLLNWYEEGTFTPTLVSAGGAVTYNVQSGSYTRIGNLVTFNLYINFNIATATGVLSVAFGALPAQKTGTTASNWPVLFSRGFIFPANKTALYIYKNTGSVNAALRWQDITGAAGTATDATALTAAFGAPEFMVSGSYLTN